MPLSKGKAKATAPLTPPPPPAPAADIIPKVEKPAEAGIIPSPTITLGKPAEAESLKDQATEGLEGAINKGLERAGSNQRVRLSKQQINALMDRFIELMKQVSQRERTRNVFIGLLDMFKLFGQQVTSATTASGENVKEKAEHSAAAIRYNKHVLKTFELSREVFEQFSGEKSLDQFIYHLRKINNAVRKDKETRDYFEELRLYVLE